MRVFFFFQAEDGIRDVERSRGLGDVYKRQAINRRLAGQRRVRNPFQSKIVRDIPYKVLHVLLRVTKSTEGFAEPFVSFGANKKAKNNFLFFIKTRQTAAFNSFWPDGAGSCAILQEDSHREDSWH